MLCDAYEVTSVNLTSMFRMTLAGSALTLIDSHFQIDQDNWQYVDALFRDRYDSVTKLKEVSDELTAMKISDFQESAKSEKDALTRLIDRLAALTPLALPSDRNDVMQKMLPKGGRMWDRMGPPH